MLVSVCESDPIMGSERERVRRGTKPYAAGVVCWEAWVWVWV